MSHSRGTQQPVTTRQRRLAALLAGILALAGLAFLALIAFVVIRQNGNMDISDRVMLPLSIVMILANLTGLVLIRRDRHIFGLWIVYLASMVIFPLAATLVLQNIFLVTGLTVVLFSSLFVRVLFPASHKERVTGFAVLTISLIIAIEFWNPSFRVGSDFNAPGFGAGIMILAGLGFLVFLLRGALGGNIRSKIIAGILLTGVVSLSVLTAFTFNRVGQLVSTLSDRVELTVNLLAEEQLINTVSVEAARADSSFESAVSQVVGLAEQLELLQERKNTLGNGTYWNAGENLIEYDEGHYSSNEYTPSSVFVPSTVELNDEVITALNVAAYMDFSAPFVLENNTQITSIYYTDTQGVITYYPNIRLGAGLPHDYDGTTQPTYRVATPLFNRDRSPRWSFPRQDPAGSGLVISVSVPVYFKDEFKGVMTADFQFDRISEQISSIVVGRTGYAFLIDSDGHIIAMPPQGYDFFKLTPELLEINDEPEQTIFDGDPPFELQQILNRMVAGGSGLIVTNATGVENFITYAPIANGSFSLGVIVPVEELTLPVIETRKEISQQVQLVVRNAAVILAILLIGAILVSLGLGQVIAAPVLRLTDTANQILDGDLAAQAEVTTRDEIGTLARAFNAMTSRLRETFEGLEQNIEERTAQLVLANERNERRAKQFQSIAQVARTISSTLDLDSLLNQITTVISHEFGFYHVGVFLLDSAGDYAVLSAANSAGGEVMLARGHRLKVGEKGLVGFVAGTRKARVALDTGADAVFFNNPDLPETRSEVALPLRAGEHVIGVLDVQSTEPNAFTQEDVAILSTLADQVSIAIQNARQNEKTQKALAESEALSRQFIQVGWSKFTGKQKLLGVRHTGAKSTLLYSKNADGTQEGFDATGPLRPKTRGAVLTLPINLRGEVIGTVNVRGPDNRQWDQDEIEIVKSIIERAAVAMENSRLLAESQKRAAKERVIGEIASRISAQSEVDELLKTAALELNRNLPGTEVAIQFRKEENE